MSSPGSGGGYRNAATHAVASPLAQTCDGRSVSGSPARSLLSATAARRSGHRIGDVGQDAVDLGADRAHGNDGGDGDQRGDQRVLDGGGAVLALHQTTENGQHLGISKNKRIRSLRYWPDSGEIQRLTQRRH